MMISSKLVSVIAVVMVMISVGAAENLQEALRHANYMYHDFLNDDAGKLVNCGNSSMSSFTAQWSPKDIKYGETVTINGDFTSAMDIDGGKACYKVWVEGIPEPVVESCSGVSCADLQTATSIFGLKIKCPIKTGDKYSMKDKKLKIQPSFQIPQGSYKGEATITTSAGVPYMCVQVQVNVL